MKVRVAAATLAYGEGAAALNDVTIEILSGEQVAFIGPSGAGKTTLLRLLATGARPSSGGVELQDEDPWQLSAAALRKLRASIGLIHQAPPLPPRQRVITAVLAGSLGRWSLAKSLASLVHPTDVEGVRHTLTRLDLADRVFARCDQLSGGQLQRVGIARVLYQQPRLVLADEPVSAMDPVLAAHTLQVLCEDAHKRGATLVVSLHAVELALTHFSRVIGLRNGRVVFDCKSSVVGDDELQALYANEQLQMHAPAAHTPATRAMSRC